MKFLLLQLIRSHLNKRGHLVLSSTIYFYLTIYTHSCYTCKYFLHYGLHSEHAEYPLCIASDLEIAIELFFKYLQPEA